MSRDDARRQVPDGRASTWPRKRDELTMSALKLLEYEFSGEENNMGASGRGVPFALSDDDSPLNVARLLEGNVAVVASSRLDDNSDDEDAPCVVMPPSNKTRASKHRTQLLLSMVSNYILFNMIIY